MYLARRGVLLLLLLPLLPSSPSLSSSCSSSLFSAATRSARLQISIVSSMPGLNASVPFECSR